MKVGRLCLRLVRHRQLRAAQAQSKMRREEGRQEGQREKEDDQRVRGTQARQEEKTRLGSRLVTGRFNVMCLTAVNLIPASQVNHASARALGEEISADLFLARFLGAERAATSSLASTLERLPSSSSATRAAIRRSMQINRFKTSANAPLVRADTSKNKLLEAARAALVASETPKVLSALGLS